MSILRDKKTSEITHISIYFSNGVNSYLSKRDYNVYMDHRVTNEETKAFFGEDDMLKEITHIVNGNFPQSILKYEIMKYNKFFQDPLLEL